MNTLTVCFDEEIVSDRATVKTCSRSEQAPKKQFRNSGFGVFPFSFYPTEGHSGTVRKTKAMTMADRNRLHSSVQPSD